jgi:hypothetical protein
MAIRRVSLWLEILSLFAIGLRKFVLAATKLKMGDLPGKILTASGISPLRHCMPLAKVRGLNYGVVQMMRLLQAVGQNSLATVAGLGDFATFASRAVAVAFECRFTE